MTKSAVVVPARFFLMAIAFCCAGNFLGTGFAWADSISPQIRDQGVIYSEAAPNESMFGNGAGADLTEASALRFEGDRKLHERKYDEAIVKLLKAVQLDPADPSSHILLARALTAKIMHSKELPDSKDLKNAIDEWKMIWHHDADQTEQVEAKTQARMLTKLAKSIEKNQIHSVSGHAELLSGSREDREFGFGM